jgi:HPt (histidine-containing phosphotransfer) domain-containing protein
LLIYNHKKEFIGIDSDALEKLHYHSMNELMKSCSDFADLFIKKPGYIHNFKNFKWIDFVMHSDANESKVLISANERTFSALLKIKTIFLADAPDEKAYAVELLKLQQIGKEEVSKTETAFSPERHMPAELPSFDDIEPTTLIEPDPLDVPQETAPSYEKPSPAPNLSLYHPESLFVADLLSEPLEESKPEISDISVGEEPFAKAAEKPMLGDYRLSSTNQALINDLEVSTNYKYDPQIAADELGLPVDLIEEFIGDYITQSKEFKEELFDAVAKSDFNHLKNLSHKLKGVAANLRIEDSFEVLSHINSTHNMEEAEAYLKHFYNIIAKLEGKSLPEHSFQDDAEMLQEEQPYIEPENGVNEDEIYAFDTALAKSSEEEKITEPDEEEIYALDVIKEIEPEELTIEDDDIYLFDTALAKHNEIDGPEEIDEIDEIEPELNKLEEEVFKDIHYDNTKAAYELGMDIDFINELKEEFITHVLSQKETLQSALEKGDIATCRQIALELKGISDNLRIDDVSSTSDEIIRSNDTKTASHHINQLFHYVVQL